MDKRNHLPSSFKISKTEVELRAGLISLSVMNELFDDRMATAMITDDHVFELSKLLLIYCCRTRVILDCIDIVGRCSVLEDFRKNRTVFMYTQILITMNHRTDSWDQIITADVALRRVSVCNVESYVDNTIENIQSSV